MCFWSLQDRFTDFFHKSMEQEIVSLPKLRRKAHPGAGDMAGFGSSFSVATHSYSNLVQVGQVGDEMI